MPEGPYTNSVPSSYTEKLTEGRVVQEEKQQRRRQLEAIDQVGAVLVVGSGKGGVGKSTVSVNLAVALATLCRELQLAGAILVTTPQDIARIDTAKALAMFQKADVPVLGVVQNMDGFICPHCGERIEIFPASHERRQLLDTVPLLATIP